ncbi:uncharacterized protein LOC113338126 isoform X1 [Papaver somniferum]|uniref:uncharacterized protein LOC113338126 isoform X1 n=1 Tax=Papaver somniferum TaxID=3469 RepID=UPI000E6F9F72|nr:uncharacterized protein LOC113338126 isoform X1 [Papaver somniferum]
MKLNTSHCCNFLVFINLTLYLVYVAQKYRTKRFFKIFKTVPVGNYTTIEMIILYRVRSIALTRGIKVLLGYTAAPWTPGPGPAGAAPSRPWVFSLEVFIMITISSFIQRNPSLSVPNFAHTSRFMHPSCFGAQLVLNLDLQLLEQTIQDECRWCIWW